MQRRAPLNALIECRGLPPNADQGRQAQTLAALLLVLLVAGTVGLVSQLLYGVGISNLDPALVLGVPMLLIPYLGVRLSYVRSAAWLTILILTLIPTWALLSGGSPQSAAYYILPIMLASIVLPATAVAWLTPLLLACIVVANRTLMVRTGPIPVLIELSALALVVGVLALIGVQYHKRTAQAGRAVLAESERNFRALAENASDGIFVIRDGIIVFVNHRALKFSGYKADEVLNTPMTRYVHPGYLALVEERYRRRLAGEEVPSRYELCVVGRNGEQLPVEVTASMTTWHGKAADLVSMRDIRERIRAEAQMRKLSGALQQAADAVMITDRNGIIEYVNPAFERITGFTRDQVIGLTPAIVKSERQGERFYSQMWDCINRGDVFTDVFINRRKDGSLYYEEKSITPLKNEQGLITHFIATGKDITERMRTQERLEHLAHHDSLTGLPNRVLFLDRLKQSLARARWSHHVVALMFIDLDRFKGVNDTLGHDAGDELLRVLSGRLKHSLRERDTVARLGGDEFAVLLDDLETEGEAADLADKLLASFREPFLILQRELFVTASIGISLFPDDGETVGTLLKNADIAMYKAKDLGKNTYQFYAADMSTRAFERLTLETSLRRALARKQFELYYQPQVDLETGHVIGFEALLRWNHPDMGLVSPTEFVGLLEDTSLILPVGRWVLRDACTQAQAWRAEMPEHWWVTVNVSGLQLGGGETFLNTVNEVLAETGLDPERLELEITESVLMHDTDRALKTLEALNDHGVRLAVDDFGTGYSSLAYLKRFAIDTLKIDRTFVRDVPDDADDRAIVRSVIALAHSLNLSVVAEGVETERQIDFLRHQGCEAAQGYLISAPLPATAVPEFVRRWHDAGVRRA